MTAASTLNAGTVLSAGIMVRLSHISPAVASLIPLEMIEGACAALRHWSAIPVTGILTVVHVSVEA